MPSVTEEDTTTMRAFSLEGFGIRVAKSSVTARESEKDTAVFSVATKLLVFVMMAVSTSLTHQPFFTFVLTTFALAFLAVGGQRSFATKLLISYVVVFVLYAAMAYFGIRILILSPMHIFMMWKAYPALIAAVAIVTTPPGMISAFLASIRFPKKLIVGVLVIFRFFPTMRSGYRRLSESLENRGLMAVGQIVRNPLDTLEYLLVPVMMNLINSADRLSSSAITRAAEAPTRRTSYYDRPIGVADIAALIACAVLCSAFVVLTL